MNFRNRDCIAETGLELLITAAGVLLCACMSVPAWAITAGTGLIIIIIHYLFRRRLYAAIARMAQRVDRVLHGQDEVLVGGSREGELAILENELEKMTVRLRDQAQALKEDKVFLADAMADISHQLRTPLTSMGLVTRMLAAGDITDKRRIELLHDLRFQEERVSWLVETMLKNSRIDAGAVIFEPHELPVRTLLSDAASVLAISFEIRGIGLVMKCDGGKLFADPAWTKEAIGNIIKNCMEHMKDGGTLYLTGRTTPVYTEIVIEDTGEGFAKEDLPHIFERYYRGQNAHKESIGIGLALAQRIITQQKGTIKAENRQQGGARFIIRFYKETI